MPEVQSHSDEITW